MKSRRTTIDVFGIPYKYVPNTAEITYRDPFRAALANQENSMSPGIFEFQPERLEADRCGCDACKGKHR